MGIPWRKIWSGIQKGLGFAAAISDDPQVKALDEFIDQVEDIFTGGGTKLAKVEALSDVIVDQTGWSDEDIAEFRTLRTDFINTGVATRNLAQAYAAKGKALSDFIKRVKKD